MDVTDYRSTIILPLAECNLTKFMEDHSKFVQDPRVWIHLVKGISNGLKVLHEVKIAHMDMKPDNILLIGVNEFL